MQDFDRVNSSDIDSDSGETDENMDAEKIVKNMKTKRKRAVNLLVRSVGAPIQKSYMVSYFINTYLNLLVLY